MIDFQAVKERLDLVDIASRYTELKKAGKELHGPCPFCGGNDRFHIYADRKDCHCRQCGKTWDAISLYAEKQGLTPVEAAKQLAGGDLPETLEPRNSVIGIPITEEPGEWESQEWQDKTKKWVHYAHRDLLDEIKGKPGREYLNSRGISVATAEVFRIGFIPECMDPRTGDKRPAITLPWVLADGRVCAFKFRFIDELAGKDKDARFSQKKHSDPRLFGSNRLTGNDTVLVIEGELNAAAGYQECHGLGVDVLSFGPERNQLGQDLAAQLTRERGYRQVILWCDDEAKTKAAATYFEGQNLTLLKSPYGLDANDLLIRFGPGSVSQLIGYFIEKRPVPIVRELPNNQCPSSHSENSGQFQVLSRFRDHIESLYRLVPDHLKPIVIELESLTLTRNNQPKAIELAQQIDRWEYEQTELEGLALRAAIFNIFDTKRVA